LPTGSPHKQAKFLPAPTSPWFRRRNCCGDGRTMCSSAVEPAGGDSPQLRGIAAWGVNSSARCPWCASIHDLHRGAAAARAASTSPAWRMGTASRARSAPRFAERGLATHLQSVQRLFQQEGNIAGPALSGCATEEEVVRYRRHRSSTSSRICGRVADPSAMVRRRLTAAIIGRYTFPKGFAHGFISLADDTKFST
jgi:hypothetical protein